MTNMPKPTPQGIAQVMPQVTTQATTQSSATPPKPPRSRRWTRPSGLPHLAAQLPKDFRSPSAVNSFIYSLAVEVTAGRVESRTAAVLGYLSQLAIQTLPLLRIEAEPEGGRPALYQFVTSIPRPDYSKLAKEDATQADAGIAETGANCSAGGTRP